MPLPKLRHLAIAALLISAPAAAYAQSDEAPSGAVNPPNAYAPSPASPDVSAPASATVGDSAAPMGSPANPIPESSPTPASQAGSLTPSDPNVVTNGPVPDTAANRAQYGGPMSAGGRATTPSGD